jgi:hypothetical protein
MNRKPSVRSLCLLLLTWLAVLSARGADPAPSPFVGEWGNVDFDTPGVTRVHIRQEGAKLIAHMWGRCHPDECDWGETTATPSEDGKVLSLTWKFGFATNTQELKLLGDGRLELVEHTHFTDNSGRPDSDGREEFAKGLTRDWSDPPEKQQAKPALR